MIEKKRLQKQLAWLEISFVSQDLEAKQKGFLVLLEELLNENKKDPFET